MYCFKEVEILDFVNKTTRVEKEYQCTHMEEYAAFDELYGWYHEEILESLKDYKQDDEDFFCGKS